MEDKQYVTVAELTYEWMIANNSGEVLASKKGDDIIVYDLKQAKEIIAKEIDQSKKGLVKLTKIEFALMEYEHGQK